MEPIIADNLCYIDQAIELLGRIDCQDYTQCSAQTLGAGIGGHIRHNIDHYECFLNRDAPRQIDYEHRQRNPEYETTPASARARLGEIRDALAGFPSGQLDEPIEVKIENPGEQPEAQWASSTGRRELQFLLSHTIHHYALIAMICRQLGTPVPEDFGVAPSTLRYREQQGHADKVAACAQ